MVQVSTVTAAAAQAIRRPWFRRRSPTVRQQVEELMLQRAKDALAAGDTKLFDSLAGKLLVDQPATREDRLDIYRILATTIMVGALFAIVVVIVGKNNPSTNLFQFVSLASGLAGIGLGWLFGTGTVRRR